MLHTNLQFTAGGNGEDGYVYAVNCNCFYTADRGPMANPPGALWKIVPATEVRQEQETALTVQQVTQAISTSGAPVFRSALTNNPFTLNLYPNETVNGKVVDFQRTGNRRRRRRDAVLWRAVDAGGNPQDYGVFGYVEETVRGN